MPHCLFRWTPLSLRPRTHDGAVDPLRIPILEQREQADLTNRVTKETSQLCGMHKAHFFFRDSL